MVDPQLRPLRFCSRCGGELAERAVGGRTRPACPACGFVVYTDPKVACAALVERGGRVLLVRRRHEPGRGLWCLPCGFADADEPPEEAARREAREETGLEVAVEQLLDAYHYTDDARGAGILLVYQARCTAGTPQAGDDADAVGFFAPDALPPISHHTHARALQEWIARTTQVRRHADTK
ncbi:MAG TPA: NUDIX domain-containing protein [Roseiflexaceae bacterium]|nr:NUDIX domain-containing protein [Roseiflexaceae bacterium]